MVLFRIIHILTLVSTVVNCITADKNVVNVLSYGASGDGNTDDTSAFMKAWNDACSSTADISIMMIPSRTFLVQPLNFTGPCKSHEVHLKLAGGILGPNGPKEWKGKSLLTFEEVHGLTIDGSGMIDGRGQGWWDISCRYHPQLPGCVRTAPTTIIFQHCSRVRMDHIFVKNSPQTHILVWNSEAVDFGFLTIDSPGNTPNTDGVHIQASAAITIHDSVIKSGDDCISIGDYCSNLTISDIRCGPGHGISIGSLGSSGNEVKVENITVQRAHFLGTSNGVRIKTYQVGRGNVKHISFVNLTFHEVQNPIIIDQHYCFSPNGCQDMKTAVHISDVRYIGSVGTSASEVALNLNCSRPMPCTNITLGNIQLEPARQELKQLTSSCNNAFGFTKGVVVPRSCLHG